MSQLAHCFRKVYVTLGKFRRNKGGEINESIFASRKINDLISNLCQKNPQKVQNKY